MKIAIINFSDVIKHPTKRMDAGYHVGKKEGKKSHKIMQGGQVEEDDISGKVMLSTEEAAEFNSARSEANKAAEKVSELKTKFDIH